MTIYEMCRILLERESISGGVKNPWVIIRAFHASVQPQRFTGEFPGAKRTGIWKRTEWLTLDIALFFPFIRLSNCRDLCWVLHPLDYLIRQKRI